MLSRALARMITTPKWPLPELRGMQWSRIQVHVGLRKPPLPTPRAKLAALEVPMDSALVKRDPEIMSGALCFTGTRVPVKNLFDYLEGSSSLEDFLEDFPTVSRERAVAVLEAARESLAADAPAA
jgi:uncharacterized protein (DUF433 family)